MASTRFIGRAAIEMTAGASASERDRWLVEFVELHGDSAYRTAYRLLGDAESAHDAVQDALESALRRWESLRDLDSAKAWLFRVLVNRSTSTLRRRVVKEKALRFLGRNPNTAMPTEDAIDFDTRVRPLLSALPLKQRIALSLRYGDERSVAEIASAMEVSTETVKTHLKRGLRRLRDELAPALRAEEQR